MTDDPDETEGRKLYRERADATARADEAMAKRAVRSFVEQTCLCGRVWRGSPGTNPAAGCPDCGPDMEAEAAWRRDNHFP